MSRLKLYVVRSRHCLTFTFSCWIGEIRVSHGRLRLRPEIALDGPQYSGRKTSRKNKSHESESEEESQELSEELLQNSELEYDSSVSEEDGQLVCDCTFFPVICNSSFSICSKVVIFCAVIYWVDVFLWGLKGLEASAVKDDELDALSREYADLRKQEE